MPKNKNSNIDGWFILDKPINISSAKAVNAVKKYFNIKKAGHAGTLDPLASGVLPCLAYVNGDLWSYVNGV